MASFNIDEALLARIESAARAEEKSIQEYLISLMEGRQSHNEHNPAAEVYKILVENVQQGLIILQNFRIVFANTQASELLQYSNDELLQMEEPLEKIIHPDFQERMQGILYRHFLGTKNSDADIKLIVGNGEVRWIHVSNTSITYRGFHAIQWAFVDITKQIESEESLAHAAAIIQSSDDAIIGKDLNGIVISWNPGAERIYGYSAAEMIGKPISIIVPNERKHEVTAILNRIRQGKSVDRYETERRSKDGRTIIISLTVSPIRDENRQISGAAVISRDITAKKQIERELRIKENRLHLITDNMRDMIIHIDQDGFVRYASPSALNLWDADPEKLIHAHFSNWLELIHPDDQEELRLRFAIRMETGEGPSIGTFRRQFPSGKYVWFEYSVSVSKDQTGQAVGFTFVLRDISRRMDIVLALQESESRLRQAMNVGRLGIWEWNIVADQTIWMGDMFRIYGINPEEFTGKANQYFNFTLPEDRELQLQNINHAFENGMTEKVLIESLGPVQYTPNKFRILRPDGSIRHVQGDAIAIIDDNGMPLRMIGVLQDVTENQKTIEALHRSEERYRRVSELTSDFAYSVRVHEDGTLEFEWMTEAFTRITGYSTENISDLFEARLIYTEDLGLYQEALEQVMQGESSQVDVRLVSADGSIRWVRTRNLPLWDEAQQRTTYIYGAAQDITEQRVVERAMLQAQKLESLGVLAGSVAHDFNNLLTGILTNATLIRLKVDRNQPIDNYLESIIAAVERAADITHQLLAYSGKGRFEVAPIDLNEQIQKNLYLLETTLPKNIEFVFDPMKPLPLIGGDAGQIQQIIMNLIINAADAYNDRSGIVEISTGKVVVDRAESNRFARIGYNIQAGSYVSLEVRDNGIGMDEGTLSHIFDPFFTTKETGRGLGLAAVQGIVRGHHGALMVHSELKVGTRFQILLPASREQVIPVTEHEQPLVETADNLILIVDDEKEIRSAMSDALTFLGYRILLAANGEEALSLYRARHQEIALILLDLTMPVLSGVETLLILEKEKLNIPVILMSGYEVEKIDSTEHSKNVAGFLKKPFRIEKLMETIWMALNENSETSASPSTHGRA